MRYDLHRHFFGCMTRIDRDKNIRELAEKIGRDFAPEKVILFGSWAWGTPGPDSDVDLLVVKETDDPRGLARQIDSALFPRRFPLDLLVYRPEHVRKRVTAGDFFVRDIMEKGKILYEQSS